MGNAVSCFDPVKEHPPYSWPKDHPERAAKIEQLKKERRNRKIVGTQGNARTVLRDDPAANTAANTAANPAANLVSIEPENDVKDLAKPVDEAVDKQLGDEVDHHVDDIERVEEAPIPVPDEPVEELVELPAEPEIEDNYLPLADDEAAAAAAAAAVVNVDTDEEEDKDESKTEQETTPVELIEDDDIFHVVEDRDLDLAFPGAIVVSDSLHEEEEQPEHETPIDTPLTPPPYVTDKDDDTDMPAKEGDTVDDPIMSSIDTRRAMFDRTEDELPQAEELRRDVLDPVTNEYISLDEYRERQRERAQGMVKERVEKFEEIDDEVSRQKAELAAIEAVRSKAMEETDWTFKHVPDPKERTEEAIKKIPDVPTMMPEEGNTVGEEELVKEVVLA